MSRTMNAAGDLALVEASAVGTTPCFLPGSPERLRRGGRSTRAPHDIRVR